MPTLSELRAERLRGPTPSQIQENRRALADAAMSAAYTAIETAEAAVADVVAAGDLATAQAAVTGLADTLGDAKTGIESVLVNLP